MFDKMIENAFSPPNNFLSLETCIPPPRFQVERSCKLNHLIDKEAVETGR